MQRYLIAPDPQARRAASLQPGETMQVWTPLLVTWRGPKKCTIDQTVGYWVDDGELWYDDNPPSRCAPPNGFGDLLAVKEACWVNDSECVIAYRADGEFPCHMASAKWMPANRMPAEAVRSLLYVLDVKARRVQSVTWQDAIAAGFKGYAGDESPESEFRAEHNRRHGKKPSLSWADNPWMWVTTVERVDV